MIRRTPLKRYTPLRALAKSKGLRRSTTPGRYKKRLWAIFSEYIRRKYADSAGNVLCVTCQASMRWQDSDAGHYHPRTDGLAVFFDERNVHPQCTYCNRYRRGNLTQYARFMIKTYGVGVLDALDALRRTTRKISEAEYLELIERYKSKLSDLDKREAA